VSNPYACASFHVEHVDKEYAAGAGTEVEVQDPEGQYQEEEQQQFVESDQAEEQYLDTDFANPDLQQGKHQIHFKPVSYIYLSYAFT